MDALYGVTTRRSNVVHALVSNAGEIVGSRQCESDGTAAPRIRYSTAVFLPGPRASAPSVFHARYIPARYIKTHTDETRVMSVYKVACYKRRASPRAKIPLSARIGKEPSPDVDLFPGACATAFLRAESRRIARLKRGKFVPRGCYRSTSGRFVPRYRSMLSYIFFLSFLSLH